MKLTALQPEPECWRTYSEYGSVLALKPDLFAMTNRAGGWIGFYIFLAQRPSIPAVENQILQFAFGDDSEQFGLLVKSVCIVP